MDVARAAAARTRAVLLDAGFTADGLLALLGASAYAALGRGEPVPARRALQDRHSTDAELVRLFVLGDPVPLADAQRHLPLADLDAVGLHLEDQQPPAALFRPHMPDDRCGSHSHVEFPAPGSVTTHMLVIDSSGRVGST